MNDATKRAEFASFPRCQFGTDKLGPTNNTWRNYLTSNLLTYARMETGQPRRSFMTGWHPGCFRYV